MTRLEPHAKRFLLEMRDLAYDCRAELVICVDNAIELYLPPAKIQRVTSAGYIESVLDECIGYCSRDWILRLDDDERASPALAAWLASGGYLTDGKEIYDFPRAYLFGDERHYLADWPWFPDPQTRLSVREKAGARTEIHVGSPWGPGHYRPYAIEHHKFLVKSQSERRSIAEKYEQIRKGAGLDDHFRKFNLPEEWHDELQIAEYPEYGDFTAS